MSLSLFGILLRKYDLGMNKKFIIGNWKMNPETLAQAQEILARISEFFENDQSQYSHSVVVCPPFVFIEEVSRILKTSSLGSYIELGAQDISLNDEKSQTGEVSGEMLSGLGVRYVIAGHSDRRYKLGESDELVNSKIKSILHNEMVPVVCIGERERDEGFEEKLKNQVKNTFKDLSGDEIGRCVVAYEPVWAISTTPGSKPDTPENVRISVDIIKGILGPNVRVLYGGSVNPSNGKDFLSQESLDGVLVGAASVNPGQFNEILKASLSVED